MTIPAKSGKLHEEHNDPIDDKGNKGGPFEVLHVFCRKDIVDDMRGARKTDGQEEDKGEYIFRYENTAGGGHPGIHVYGVDGCHHFIDMSESAGCHR